MKIRWLATATIEIQCGTESILIDPYYQRKQKKQNALIDEALERTDLILITHPHPDHFSDITSVVSKTKSHICVSKRGVETVRKLDVDHAGFQVIKAGDIIHTEETTIRVYQSAHVVFDLRLMVSTLLRTLLPWNIAEGIRLGLLNRTFRINEEDIFGFEIIHEGERLFVLGSAALCEDVSYPEGVDCLIFPYQGRSDLDTYAPRLIERFKAKKIILSHFDNAFPPITSCVKTNEIMRHFPQMIRPEPGEEIEI